MATSLSYVKCTQCGFPEAYYQFYTRSGEEELLCPVCGLQQQVSILIDRSKSAAGKSCWKLDGQGQPIYRFSEKRGRGIVVVTLVETGGIVYYPFKRQPTDKMIRTRIKRILSNPEIDASASYITRWDEFTGSVVSVFGQLPSAGSLHEESVEEDYLGECSQNMDEEEEGVQQLSPDEIPF